MRGAVLTSALLYWTQWSCSSHLEVFSSWKKNITEAWGLEQQQDWELVLLPHSIPLCNLSKTLGRPAGPVPMFLLVSQAAFKVTKSHSYYKRPPGKNLKRWLFFKLLKTVETSVQYVTIKYCDPFLCIISAKLNITIILRCYTALMFVLQAEVTIIFKILLLFI